MQAMRALEAQRLLDWLTLRVAPAAAAGLISYSHIRELGEALIVFAGVLVATRALDGARFPLHLMRTARFLLAAAAPVLGSLAAWGIGVATGDGHPFAQYEAMIAGAWLVTLLGAWIRERLGTSITARIAVIGSREFALDLAAELAAAGVDAYCVVGWIAAGEPERGDSLRRLGAVDDARGVVLRERIELLVCAPDATPAPVGGPDGTAARVAERCVDLPVRLIGANQLYEDTLGHVPIGTIDAAWFRYIMHPNFHAGSPASKRAFDLVVGAALAFLFLPALAIAALAIKLNDRGPVLYRQQRVGEHGLPFEMLKLRTMKEGAEPHGPEWSGPSDARVTRIGRLLRRTHVDELPQLWNVLRGQMTLVGPRPERPEIVRQLELRFGHYTRRHLVKPGIAGWAALRCGYAGSELGSAWKLSHDLFYVKRRSALADGLILAETAVEVFRDAHRALRAPDPRFLIGERAGG
jgi:lipopolysaccharide/colanic/teichoic acid biosynthesis glycosyltransferase